MITETTHFRRSADVVHRHVAGETILVPVRGNVADMQRLFALDPAGSHVWGCLEKGCSISEVATSLTAAFDVSDEDALVDLDSFFEQLLSRELIYEVNSSDL
jgi:hypothetical protein